MSSAPVDERLLVTHARRSSRMLRTELRSPWAFALPESLGLGTALHVVLQGACWLGLTTSSPLLPLGEGDIALLPRGARHMLVDDPSTPAAQLPSLRASSPGGRRSLLISGGYPLKRSLPLLPSLPEVVHVPAERCGEHGVRAIIDVLGAELEDDRPGTATVVPALADALLPLVIRTWLDDCAPVGRGEPFPETLSDPAIAAALERIYAEPERAWTVGALAREVTLSRSAFARRFSRAVGEPPHAYLTRWRMTLAGRLLRDSDLNLASVARHVGYASEFAFGKAFKRDYGMAPGTYRRELAA